MGPTPWLKSLCNSTAGWNDTDVGRAGLPVEAQRVHRGDIVSVSLKLHDGRTNGDIEWRINDRIACKVTEKLTPASYRLSVELCKHEYEVEAMGVTLLSYTQK